MTREVDYLLIGTITADLTPQGRILGGTVSYASRVAQAFGHRVGVMTSAIPDDPLLDQLRPYADVTVFPSAETTTYENIYGPDGRTQYIRGICAPISRGQVRQANVSAPLLHLAPLADEVDPTTIQDFPGATTLLTPQGWMRRWDADGRVHFKRWFDAEIVKAVDIVVFSREDIDKAPEVEQEFAQVAKHLIVTNGQAGGFYYYRGTPREFPALSVDIVDLTGAGDVYAAAFLSALPRTNYDYYRAACIAARLASISVTRVGIDGAPTQQEIDDAFAAFSA